MTNDQAVVPAKAGTQKHRRVNEYWMPASRARHGARRRERQWQSTKAKRRRPRTKAEIEGRFEEGREAEVEEAARAKAANGLPQAVDQALRARPARRSTA